MFYIGFLNLKMSDSLIPSFLVSDVSKSLRSLTKNERCEQIAKVARQKWATMSDSLRSLTKNEQPWANRSGCSQIMIEWANRLFFSELLIRSFLGKNEQFAQKTDEQIPSTDICKRVKRAICFFVKNERFAHKKTNERITHPESVAEQNVLLKQLPTDCCSNMYRQDRNKCWAHGYLLYVPVPFTWQHMVPRDTVPCMWCTDISLQWFFNENY